MVRLFMLPGDVILTRPPEDVGMHHDSSPGFLKPEEIKSIGMIKNKVVIDP